MPNNNKGFIPYTNESDALTIGDELTVENRLDRISISGFVELTMDKQGLKNAYELKRIVCSVIEALRRMDLPDRIEIQAPNSVDNPFV
jgi:hypothetical protein